MRSILTSTLTTVNGKTDLNRRDCDNEPVQIRLRLDVRMEKPT